MNRNRNHTLKGDPEVTRPFNLPSPFFIVQPSPAVEPQALIDHKARVAADHRELKREQRALKAEEKRIDDRLAKLIKDIAAKKNALLK